MHIDFSSLNSIHSDHIIEQSQRNELQKSNRIQKTHQRDTLSRWTPDTQKKMKSGISAGISDWLQHRFSDLQRWIKRIDHEREDHKHLASSSTRPPIEIQIHMATPQEKGLTVVHSTELRRSEAAFQITKIEQQQATYPYSNDPRFAAIVISNVLAHLPRI